MYFLTVKNFVVFVALICTLTPIKIYANESAWQALRDGKAVAIMRHAIAPSGVDNSALTREACKGERNLSQQGRDQAIRIGEIFRANDIVNAKVYTSSLCRCVDTAELLAFNSPSLLNAINAFYPDRSSAPKQTVELKQWIKQQITQSESTNILVTHGFNVTELTGEFASQGEFLIIAMDGDGVVVMHHEKVD